VIRVVVADDHPLFRDGLRTLASLESNLELVGEAANGADAVDLTLELEPDVVVMDLHMPDLNGIDATRLIAERQPGVGILVLTMFEDDDSVFAAMRAGARGYLLKGAGNDDVVRAIEAVARGDAIFGPSIATRVIDFFARRSEPPQPFPELTAREREVLELIAQGRSNADIAAHFVLSQKTVRNNVSSIFTKLRVADRAQAIVRAREAGLGRS
jgi:DNA-binding NarL/FixJ family response regulator